MADEAVSPISVERIATLYPGIRPLAYRVLQDVKNMTQRALNIAQARRSMSDQLAIYAKGRKFKPITSSFSLPEGEVPATPIAGIWTISTPGNIVTNAKPGSSWHCYGLAFDCSWAGKDPYLLNAAEDERHVLWTSFGDMVKGNGMQWGGDTIHLVNGVSDIPHAEMTYGLPLAAAQELFNQGGIQSVWGYLDRHRGVPVGQEWGVLDGKG